MLTISLSLALPWVVYLLVWRLDLGPAQAGLEFSFPGAGVVTGMTNQAFSLQCFEGYRFSVAIRTRDKTMTSALGGRGWSIRPCLGLQDIGIFHPDVDGGFSVWVGMNMEACLGMFSSLLRGTVNMKWFCNE